MKIEQLIKQIQNLPTLNINAPNWATLHSIREIQTDNLLRQKNQMQLMEYPPSSEKYVEYVTKYAVLEPFLTKIANSSITQVGYLGFIHRRYNIEYAPNIVIPVLMALLPNEKSALETLVKKLDPIINSFYPESTASGYPEKSEILASYLANLHSAVVTKLEEMDPNYRETGDPLIINISQNIINNLKKEEILSKREIKTISRNALEEEIKKPEILGIIQAKIKETLEFNKKIALIKYEEDIKKANAEIESKYRSKKGITIAKLKLKYHSEEKRKKAIAEIESKYASEAEIEKVTNQIKSSFIDEITTRIMERQDIQTIVNAHNNSDELKLYEFTTAFDKRRDSLVINILNILENKFPEFYITEISDASAKKEVEKLINLLQNDVDKLPKTSSLTPLIEEYTEILNLFRSLSPDHSTSNALFEFTHYEPKVLKSLRFESNRYLDMLWETIQKSLEKHHSNILAGFSNDNVNYREELMTFLTSGSNRFRPNKSLKLLIEKYKITSELVETVNSNQPPTEKISKFESLYSANLATLEKNADSFAKRFLNKIGQFLHISSLKSKTEMEKVAFSKSISQSLFATAAKESKSSQVANVTNIRKV